MPELIPKDANGQTPKWVIYGAGAAAALGLFVYFKNKQGTSGSTVAAGTSINAALGSLQEEVLNAQGQEGINAATQRDLTSNATEALSQQSIAQTRSLTLTGNALAGRIMQQDAGAYGNASASNAWTDYLNGILPASDAAYAAATDPTAVANGAHLTTLSTGTH